MTLRRKSAWNTKCYSCGEFINIGEEIIVVGGKERRRLHPECATDRQLQKADEAEAEADLEADVAATLAEEQAEKLRRQGINPSGGVIMPKATSICPEKRYWGVHLVRCFQDEEHVPPCLFEDPGTQVVDEAEEDLDDLMHFEGVSEERMERLYQAAREQTQALKNQGRPTDLIEDALQKMGEALKLGK